MSQHDNFAALLQKMSLDDMVKYYDNNRFSKLRTHGNSVVVTIPKAWLRKLKWKIGERVQVTLNGDNITIKRNKNEQNTTKTR